MASESVFTDGTYSGAASYWISAKYTDSETGFLYYGYRYYNSVTGRWLSRDPIGERGGANLNLFIENRSVELLDPFGLDGWTRFIGGAKFLGGGVEMIGGFAMAGGGTLLEGGSLGAASPVSIPAMLGGVFFMGHGWNTARTGWGEMWTGDRQRTKFSQVVGGLVGSPAVGETVDAFAGIASGPATSLTLIRSTLATEEGLVVVYRGVSEAEYRALQTSGQIAARGGSAEPTAIGRLLHSLTYRESSLLPPQIRYSSGYSSVTALPSVGRHFARGAGERVARLGVNRSDLLLSANPFEAEFLLKGGTQVRFLGSTRASEQASLTVRGFALAGSGRMAGEGLRLISPAIERRADEFFRRRFGTPESGQCGVLWIIPVELIQHSTE